MHGEVRRVEPDLATDVREQLLRQQLSLEQLRPWRLSRQFPLLLLRVGFRAIAKGVAEWVVGPGSPSRAVFNGGGGIK